MSLDDVSTKVKNRDEGVFSFHDLYSDAEWERLTVQEKRGLGRSFYSHCIQGGFNVNGFTVEPVQKAKNPQRYIKRKTAIPSPISPIGNNDEPIYLNALSSKEHSSLSDVLNVLALEGKTLAIVKIPATSPDRYQHTPSKLPQNGGVVC